MHDLTEALTPEVLAYGIRAMGLTSLKSLMDVKDHMDIHAEGDYIHARFYTEGDPGRWWTLSYVLTEASYPDFLKQVADEMEKRGIGGERVPDTHAPEHLLLANYEAILFSRSNIIPPTYRNVDLVGCCAYAVWDYGGGSVVRLSIAEDSLLLQYPTGEILATGTAFTYDRGASLIPSVAAVLLDVGMGMDAS